MKNLIRADMWRILKRKSLYICLVIVLIYQVVKLLEALGDDGFNATGFINGMHSGLGAPMVKLLITLPVFFAVFSREFTSKSMLCVLGHGMTRGRIVAAKLIDAAILITGEFILITLFYGLLMGYGTELAISANQMVCAYIYIWLMAFRLFGYIAFSALVFFLSGSASAGVASCVFFTYLFEALLNVAELFVDIPIRDYTFDGQLGWAYTTIEAGGFGYQIFPAALMVIAAIAATVIFYQRKELEF